MNILLRFDMQPFNDVTTEPTRYQKLHVIFYATCLKWDLKFGLSILPVCMHATEIQPWNRNCRISISKRILKHLLMKNNA